MRLGGRGGLALAGALLAVAFSAAVTSVVRVLATYADRPVENFGTPVGDLVLPVAALAFALTGTALVLRHNGETVGWLLLGGGSAVEVMGVTDEVGPQWASARAAVVFGALILVALPLVFPDGRLPSTRWRPVLWVGGLCAVTAMVLPATGIVLAVPGAAAVLSLVSRYRQGDAVVRAQLRWLLWSVVVALGTLLGLGLLGQAMPRPTPMWFRYLVDACNLLIAAIPVAIGVAVARYRLWTVDVLADRGVTLAFVAAFTGAVYVAVVVGIGGLLDQSGDVWLLVVATVLLAVTIEPVRRLSQRAAHRIVYGDRPDPYQVLADFSRRAAASYLGDDAFVSCARAAATATGSARADAWARTGDRWQHVAAWPPGSSPQPPPDVLVPVVQSGTTLGAISVSDPDRLTEHDRSMLSDLAAQSAVLFRGIALTADLGQRLDELSKQADELRASRARILAAEDTARQRIERDLHDGAQQRLVALGVALQRMRHGLADEQMLTQLDSASTDLRRALAELRELARGINPTLLAEAGLADAVSALVERSPVPTRLVGVPSRRYPRAIETTAYYVVAEALTNVMKHAPEATAQVHLCEERGWLVVAVTDDGSGGVDESNGSGLRGLRDRVAAVGGVLDVVTGPGTCVQAELPCD